MASAIFYDGHSGVRHSVDAVLAGGTLTLYHEGEPFDTVEATALILRDRGPAGITLGLEGRDGWRLKFADPVPLEIDALLPRHSGYGGWIDRIGLWRTVGICAAVSTLIVTIGYLAPTWLAPLVPPSFEKRYGDALVGDFGGKYCATPLGDQALKRMAARLDPKAADLNIRVVDLPIVNAAALPAGNILLFDKLFETVETPEELAGILAHEIAHVRRRHVTAAMIREMGVGIFAAALGGTTGGNVDGFVALTFTRRAETEADDDAVAMLTRAGISPRPTAAFFKRLGKTESAIGRFEPALAYLSSHPLSKGREQKFSGAERKGAHYGPALSPREWTELRAICSRRPPAG